MKTASGPPHSNCSSLAAHTGAHCSAHTHIQMMAAHIHIQMMADHRMAAHRMAFHMMASDCMKVLRTEEVHKQEDYTSASHR